MEQLTTTGLRYGDTCTVISHTRPRKKIALNRTRWDIVPEGHLAQDLPVIHIPGKFRSFHWRLELVELDGGSVFLLKSIDGVPFHLNGQYVREAFVEGQDTLGLGLLGRIEFSRQGPLTAPHAHQLLDDGPMMASRLPVLIQGETGTGKSHLAREIHRLSKRAGPLVTLNIASLAPGLIESELFGHKKGSFTGAHADHAGALAMARGGTLFLDEIDSLSRELQAKLLLFLDHGHFRPVGGSKEEKTDARLIFASGKPLRELVKQDKMRSDFYFRLNQGALVDLVPLRDRPEDIVRHCQMFCLEKDVTILGRLLDFYKTLPWPGNIRQLRGHLEAKKVRSKTRKLDFDEWDERLLEMTSDLMLIGQQGPLLRTMDEVKREYALFAYKHCREELDKTAKVLGINPKTLRTWISDPGCR